MREVQIQSCRNAFLICQQGHTIVSVWMVSLYRHDGWRLFILSMPNTLDEDMFFILYVVDLSWLDTPPAWCQKGNFEEFFSAQ
jgi:hypothetical protein